jgi:hypothetical protein
MSVDDPDYDPEDEELDDDDITDPLDRLEDNE